MANTKYTYFSATISPTTVLQANPNRRRLNIYSYTLPEEIDANSIWLNDAGNTAVAFQCKQMLVGAIFEYGGSDDFVSPLMLRFQSCPTGAISVVTSAGTHRGLIEEFS